VGVSGATVKGRVVPATESDVITGAKGSIHLTLSPTSPAEQWPTDIITAAESGNPLYRAQVDPDGSFIFYGIPPGDYDYSAYLYRGNINSLASGALKITAPETNVADLKLHHTGVSPVGKSVPSQLGKTFDGKPIQTSDFANKYIVLVIWETQTGSFDEHRPSIEKFAQSLQPNPRVALLSLNTDTQFSSSDGIHIRPSKMPGPGWIQGYLSTADTSLSTDFDTSNSPAIAIISPEGKILTIGVKGAELGDRLRALMK
jgi:hypothetical protein